MDAARLQRALHRSLHHGPLAEHLPGTRAQRVVTRIGQFEVAPPVLLERVPVKLLAIDLERDDSFDHQVDALEPSLSVHLRGHLQSRAAQSSAGETLGQ